MDILIPVCGAYTYTESADSTNRLYRFPQKKNETYGRSVVLLNYLILTLGRCYNKSVGRSSIVGRNLYHLHHDQSQLLYYFDFSPC